MKAETPSVVAIQQQIRTNASQLQDYFSDLYEWEKSINKDDAARTRAVKTAQPAALPPPRTKGVGGVDAEEKQLGGRKLDAHTYDKGYKRWEQFDVDAALQEADDDTPRAKDPEPLADARRRVVAATEGSSAAATSKSREELEREEGNTHYKRGDFVAAIKSYTRCLGYNPQNAVVLSNRAIAYLKNREFVSAEDDCTLAIKADPTHVKSYSRRGTARNSLGKHRLALLDFQRATALEPKSRQIQTQLQSTRELIRTAIKRSPKRTAFSIEVVGGAPETDGDVNDNKENRRSQQKEGASAAETPRKKPLKEPNSTEPPQTDTAASTTKVKTKGKKESVPILPKLPKKAPTTSYEFGRVWKTLALRGDSEQKTRLTALRAEYLRMIKPASLLALFKTGMESDILCEIFNVFRNDILFPRGPDSAVSKDAATFVLEFASHLTKVPRFNVTIMLLSDSEREDMQSVFSRLHQLVEDDEEAQKQEVANLKKMYELV